MSISFSQSKFSIFLRFFILCLSASACCNAQNYQNKLKDLYAANDTSAQSLLLKEWELKSPADPELYIASFNHYMRKSKEEQLALEKTQRAQASLQRADSTADIAAMYGNQNAFTDYYGDKALEYLQKGILKFPDRLDLRFTRIQALGQKERYDEYTYDIIQTLEQSNTNKNAWKATNNELIKDPQKFMLGGVQEFVVQLYNTNDYTLLESMRAISQTALKYYPQHIESLSNLSIVYLLKKQYDKALDPLLKAEKLAPKDVIVLSNIAKAYTMKEDLENATAYYQLCIKYGDAKVKKYAQEQIDALQKN